MTRASLGEQVGQFAGWLTGMYALELKFDAGDFVLELTPASARDLLPAGCSSGLVVYEDETALEIGLHVGPQDCGREGTVIEETSHLVCVAWHAARELPVSPLILELQAEVDRFAFARLREDGVPRQAMAHFDHFEFAAGLEPATRDRYRTAHNRAHEYCRGLEHRYPRRADTPGLVAELRRFYRASPAAKLRAA